MFYPVNSIMFVFCVFLRAQSAYACHGHTVQLSAGLCVQDGMLVVSSNPVRG